MRKEKRVQPMKDARSLPRLFADLQPQAADPLLALIALFREDPRPEKIDLGVGVYRNADGATPVFASVKAAETVLLRDQTTKSYLGPEGDLGFLAHISRMVFGELARQAELVAVQTPGGTGALRLAAELIAAGRSSARIWMGAPSWPNHVGIFRQAGLNVETAPYFDPAGQKVVFDRLIGAIEAAVEGDAILLQGACHNPTGADLSLDQWSAVANLLQRRRAVPIVDTAYQGLGDGLDEDVAGLRILLNHCETVIVAQSCDKNFGLYRERTGALLVRTSPKLRELVRSNVLELARRAWSMPPDHGAAVVRLIFESEHLVSEWRAELSGMRARLNGVRKALAEALPPLSMLREQRGLFALLPLSEEAVAELRRGHGVYMAGSGRINIAGVTSANLPSLARALGAVL